MVQSSPTSAVSPIHHAHAVIDEDAPSDGGPRVDLDAGEKARDV